MKSTCGQSNNDSWSGSIGPEVIGGVEGKSGLSGYIQVKPRKQVPLGIPLLKLMRVVNRIIDDYVLLGFIGKIDVKRQSIAHEDKSSSGLNVIHSVVVDVSVVYSMEDGAQDQPFVIKNDSYFKIMVSSRGNQNILSIEVRGWNWLYEGRWQEYCIVGHMKVISFQQFLQIDERSGENGYFWILDVSLDEINNKNTTIDLCDVESIGIGVRWIQHVSIAEVRFFLIPARTSHEIIAVDYVKFVHFITALRVETGLV